MLWLRAPLKLPRSLLRKLEPRAEFWRRLAYAGARHGPEFWLKLSPPVFGVAFALALPHKRAVVQANLRAAVGRRPLLREQVDVFRTFASYAHCLAESLATERPEAQRPQVLVRHPERLQALLAQPSGFILGTAHAGSWDAAARLLVGDLKREVIVVMRREPDARARELHDRIRRHSGVRIVHVGEHPLDALPLLSHLQRGGLVAVQLDRAPPGSRSVQVQLFERPFRMPEGPFSLAALAQVPLVPLFVRRRGHFAYEFAPAEPIRLVRRPAPAEIVAAAQTAASAMADFIRESPTQWFQFDEAVV